MRSRRFLTTLTLLLGAVLPRGYAAEQTRKQPPRKIDPDQLYQTVFSRVVERHVKLHDDQARQAFAARFNPQKVGHLTRLSQAYDKAQEMLDSLGCGDRLLDPAAAATTFWQREANRRGNHGLRVSLQHEPALRQKLPTNGNPIIRDQALLIADGREELEVDQADSDLAPGVKSKDVIVSIDGELTDGMSADEARGKMCGARGSELSLWLRRSIHNLPRLNAEDHDPGVQFIPVTVTRGWQTKDCVSGRAKFDKPNELYEIKISMCDPAAVKQMERELSVAAKSFKGLFLDLRYGNKTETTHISNAMIIAQFFVESGLLGEGQVREDGALTTLSWSLDKDSVTFTHGDKVEKKPRQKRIFTGPVVVLIDNDSCLCNQMLAAILQAHGVGVYGPQPELAPLRRGLISLQSHDLEGWALDLAIGHYNPAGRVDAAKVALKEHVVVPSLDTTGKVPADAQNAAVEALKKLCGIGEEKDETPTDID